MQLPLILGEEDADYQKNITYKFVIRNGSNLPLYERYKTHIVFVIFRRVDLSGNDIDYMVHIYDIRKNRQGILLLKKPLTLALEYVNPEYLKLDFEEINSYTFRLFFFFN